MTNRAIRIRKEYSNISFNGNKKERKRHDSEKFHRIFNNMTIEEGNKLFAEQWQKMEVYPYCD